jgi:uncharacterized protein
MAMRTACFAWLVIGLCFNGSYGVAQDASRRALAEELLKEMDMKANMEKSFAMIKKMMPAQMERMKQTMEKSTAGATGSKKGPKEMVDKATDAAAKVSSKMMDEMTKELSWDNIKDEYVTLYAETFTEEDLRGLVAFYKSPAGRAFTKKQPELMRRSMELTQKHMLQWMPKMQAMTKELIESSKKDAQGPAAPVREPPKKAE